MRGACMSKMTNHDDCVRLPLAGSDEPENTIGDIPRDVMDGAR